MPFIFAEKNKTIPFACIDPLLDPAPFWLLSSSVGDYGPLPPSPEKIYAPILTEGYLQYTDTCPNKTGRL